MARCLLKWKRLSIDAPPATCVVKFPRPKVLLPWWIDTHRRMDPYLKQFSRETTELQTDRHTRTHRTDSITSTAEAGGNYIRCTIVISTFFGTFAYPGLQVHQTIRKSPTPTFSLLVLPTTRAKHSLVVCASISLSFSNTPDFYCMPKGGPLFFACNVMKYESNDCFFTYISTFSNRNSDIDRDHGQIIVKIAKELL